MTPGVYSFSTLPKTEDDSSDEESDEDTSSTQEVSAAESAEVESESSSENGEVSAAISAEVDPLEDSLSEVDAAISASVDDDDQEKPKSFAFYTSWHERMYVFLGDHAELNLGGTEVVTFRVYGNRVTFLENVLYEECHAPLFDGLTFEVNPVFTKSDGCLGSLTVRYNS